MDGVESLLNEVKLLRFEFELWHQWIPDSRHGRLHHLLDVFTWSLYIMNIVLVSWIEFLVMLVVGGQNVILNLSLTHDLEFALEGALEMIGMIRADMINWFITPMVCCIQNKSSYHIPLEVYSLCSCNPLSWYIYHNHNTILLHWALTKGTQFSIQCDPTHSIIRFIDQLLPTGYDLTTTITQTGYLTGWCASCRQMKHHWCLLGQHISGSSSSYF